MSTFWKWWSNSTPNASVCQDMATCVYDQTFYSLQLLEWPEFFFLLHNLHHFPSLSLKTRGHCLLLNAGNAKQWVNLQNCKGTWAYVVTLFNWTPIFGRYMARLVLKNGNQKDMCTNEIGLYAHNIDTIRGSFVNTIGRIFVPFSKHNTSF